MKGTIIWVKLPLNSKDEFIKEFHESISKALSKNLEDEDKVLITTGDTDIKCFNGNFIELSEEERNELVAKLLK